MTSPQRLYTEQEYLDLEEVAEEKHEYVNGEILAVAGAEPEHALLCASVTAALVTGVSGRPCFVFGNDMRLKVDASGMYTYPDVLGLCGRPQFEPTRPRTLVNPSFIVEVLSPSTEAYDRGAKFDHYKLIPSFQEYVLVGPEYKYIERYVRRGELWLYNSFYHPDDLIEIPSVAATLRVGDVYQQVDALNWPTDPPRAPRLVREQPPSAYAPAGD